MNYAWIPDLTRKNIGTILGIFTIVNTKRVDRIPNFNAEDFGIHVVTLGSNYVTNQPINRESGNIQTTSNVVCFACVLQYDVLG